MAKDRRRHSEEHVIRTGVFLYTVPGKYTYKVERLNYCRSYRLLLTRVDYNFRWMTFTVPILNDRLLDKAVCTTLDLHDIFLERCRQALLLMQSGLHGSVTRGGAAEDTAVLCHAYPAVFVFSGITGKNSCASDTRNAQKSPHK